MCHHSLAGVNRGTEGQLSSGDCATKPYAATHSLSTYCVSARFRVEHIQAAIAQMACPCTPDRDELPRASLRRIPAFIIWCYYVERLENDPGALHERDDDRTRQVLKVLTMTPGMLGKTGFSLEHELEVRHQSATYAALRVLVPVSRSPSIQRCHGHGLSRSLGSSQS